MKIGWVSPPPYAQTGYGRIAREVLPHIADRHEVYSIGDLGGVTVWGGKLYLPTEAGKTYPVLPSMGRLGGRDIVPHYHKMYNLDVVVTHWDHFAVNYADKVNVPMIHYLPVDGDVNRKFYDDVKSAYRLIAFSKFGYDQLLKWFAPARISYIPHGCLTDIFKPQGEDATGETRGNLHPKPVPEDAFLIVYVGANVGPRKRIPQLMLVFKRFLERHGDAYLCLYTNMQAAYPKGYDLTAFADMIGILPHVRYPRVNPIINPAEDEEMAQLYSSADVYCSCSIAEGFGLPLLESQACGTPCIVPDNTSQRELVLGHGWVYGNIPRDEWVEVPVYVPSLYQYEVPSMKRCLEALEDAYQNRGKLEEYGRKSRRFALKYSWKKILPMWDEFFDKVETELELFKNLG